MIIIGITGTIGAGKGAFVDYLVQRYGFLHYSVREFLEGELNRRTLPINRDTMTEVSNELRANHNPGYIVQQLYKKAVAAGKNSVIESIRTVGEIEVLRKSGEEFYLVALDAEPKTRYERIVKRNHATDHISFRKFLSQEEREMKSNDPNKQNLSACMRQADFLIKNEGTLAELWGKIDEVVTSFL